MYKEYTRDLFIRKNFVTVNQSLIDKFSNEFVSFDVYKIETQL